MSQLWRRVSIQLSLIHIFKGGREALGTNRALHASLTRALEKAGLPQGSLILLETREDVGAMLKEDALIDLIIPRGSNTFVRWIMDNSRIPVLGHADGICHVYVDKDADLDMALRVAVDSKTQNVSVCNAMETLLVHRDVAEAFLPPLAQAMGAKGVQLRGDEATRALIACDPATEADWDTEYLDLILSMRVVDSLEAAIEMCIRDSTKGKETTIPDYADDHEAVFPAAQRNG